MAPPPEGSLLHVGCGSARLEGWVNIDALALPGVDVVADVTRGLNFANARAVFAEHFLEHLSILDALKFLGEAHRVLAPGAWLRLSTPNLDWVWQTHGPALGDPAERRARALAANRGFYAWGHQFLWNASLLEEALAASGFAPVRECGYGESDLELFRGIERHEKYPDVSDLPHVLIREARKSDPEPERLARLYDLIHTEFWSQLDPSSSGKLRLEIAELSAHIAWMEQSRFWKARNRWFAFKSRF